MQRKAQAYRKNAAVTIPQGERHRLDSQPGDPFNHSEFVRRTRCDMAQDVNAPKREQHTDDEEWFDLQSLAPEDTPGEEPVEVCSGRKARAYYAPPPSGGDAPERADTSARVSSLPRNAEQSFRDTYGPLVYFAFLALIPVVSVVLFVLAPFGVPQDEPMQEPVEQEAVPAPPAADRKALAPAPMPTSALLRVDSDPEGAYVYVDGALAGITPYQSDTIESGWRAVVLKMNDHIERDTLVYVDPEAVTTLALALDSTIAAPISIEPDPEPPPAFDAAREQEVEERPLVPEVGEVRVETVPDRAVVRLDGEVVGRTPLLLGDLAPGMYDLVLSMPGYASQTRRVDVGPGRRSTVRAELVAQTGTLSVIVRPWGSIYINDTLLVRDTDLRRSLDVAAGSHVVRVVHPVLGEQERRVDVRAGQTTSVTFDLL
jgi:hypothetical protein